MFFDKEKSCQTRSSSTNSNRTLSRQKSLIRIPSTSKIPKDFFRQSLRHRRSFPENCSAVNSLEITFMPSQLKKQRRSDEQLKRSNELEIKPLNSVRRIGKRTYEKQNKLKLSCF